MTGGAAVSQVLALIVGGMLRFGGVRALLVMAGLVATMLLDAEGPRQWGGALAPRLGLGAP